MAAGQFPMANPGVRPETIRRLRLLVRIVFVWVVILLVRLLHLQIIHHDEYLRLAQSQQEKLEKIQPPRAAILDRTGRRLAMSLPVDSVFINPLLIKSVDMQSAILAQFLGLDAKNLAEHIQIAIAQHKGFLWIKRKVTPEESERLRSLKLDWIGITPESRRYYPYDTLAAHVLGGVDPDDQGTDGIEFKFNDELAGAAGYIRLSTDVQQHSFASAPEGTPAQPGRDIKLTIDSRIQYIAEQALKSAINEHHCIDGSVVVMNPNTGEILALANYPTYDPNQPLKRGDDVTARQNLAVSVPFEPGSVFKVITLSAALETTDLRPDSVINCGNGVLNLFGRVIHDDVHDHFSSLSMADVLAHSSNIGAINIGIRVGKENLYKYIRKFGFGSRIGLPLSGESPGMVHALQRWQATSIGSVPMGHEISVTVMQLAQACSTIANGGFLVKPRLLIDSTRETPEQIIRPETAIQMRQMMEGVNLRGTGRLYAQISGYTSGGKTGTAQMIDPETGKYTHLHNASYMGFAPVANPRIVVVVSAHGASGLLGYGAQVAAPVFASVAGATLRMMEIPQDLPETLTVADTQLRTSSSVPLPLVSDAQSSGDQRAFLSVGPKVPNFAGKTEREVGEESERLGIPVDFTGSGLAREQVPAPGSTLSSGERVRVRFGR